MSSSQRSESINHFFDGHVQSKTTLKEFIEKYEIALEKRNDAEDEADHKSISTEAYLKTFSPLEKEAAKLYTRGMFKKIQEEIVEIAACHPTILYHDPNHMILRVRSFERLNWRGKTMEIVHDYTVDCYPKDEEVNCSCKCFPFRGYLCRHALLGLTHSGIFHIPHKYIIKRWTKDMRYRHAEEEYKAQISSHSTTATRYTSLTYQLMKVAEVGCMSDRAYHLLLSEISSLTRRLIDANAMDEGRNGVDEICVQQGQECMVVKDPPMVRTKGRGRQKRLMSALEKNSRSKQRRPRGGRTQFTLPHSDADMEGHQQRVQVDDAPPDIQSSIQEQSNSQVHTSCVTTMLDTMDDIDQLVNSQQGSSYVFSHM